MHRQRTATTYRAYICNVERRLNATYHASSLQLKFSVYSVPYTKLPLIVVAMLSRCRCSNCDGWSYRRRLLARLCQRPACRVFSGDAACLRSHSNEPRSTQRSRVTKYDRTRHQFAFIVAIQSFCRWSGDRWGLGSHLN